MPGGQHGRQRSKRFRRGRIQYQVDAIHRPDGAGKFLKGGNVGKGHPAAFGLAQTFRYQLPQHRERRRALPMRQCNRLAGGPALGFRQSRAGNQRVGFGKQPDPIGIVAGTLGGLPFPQGSVQDRIQADQQEGSPGTLAGSCIGCQIGGGGAHRRVPQQMNHQVFGDPTAGSRYGVIGAAGHNVHTAAEGVQGGMHGNADTGKHGGPQGDADQDRAGPPGMLANLAQAEPVKKL